MNITWKINIYDCLTYALIFALIKPYFLPEGLREASKILILICIFLFTISKTKKSQFINLSCLFSGAILLSAILAYTKGEYQFKDFLDSILYVITFYDVYSFVGLCRKKNRFGQMLSCIYNIVLLYCILTFFSVLLTGVSNNSNQASYVFGNKFTSSYLFIFLIALYGAIHDINLWRNKIGYVILFVFSILFTLYMGCATATVTLIALLALVIISSQRIRTLMLNEKFVVFVLLASAFVAFLMEKILEIRFINDIVTVFFNKSYTVSGRLEIYNIYLIDIIKSSFWFGYGYSNSVMKSLTGIYANAQNGLLEIMVNNGFFGVLSLLITVFLCFKNTLKDKKSFYISLIVYGMIIASIFEVAINWFFLLGVCLIRWNCNLDYSE